MTLKYGRRAPKAAPALRLGPLLTGVVPDHPLAQDNFTALNGGWQMLGNDQYGDCVSVTAANVRRLMTHLAGNEVYPNVDQVFAFYKTQNPNFPSDDNGMDIQTALETLVNDGDKYFDGKKALAFAKVDHTNVEEVKAAISIFGYVWTGVNVYQENMVQFDAGQPWDYAPNSALDGGHSIVTGGYGAGGTGALAGDEKFITWARETSFTDAFWANNVEEAWVVIWPEHLGTEQFQQGIDVAKLASDYTALTGKPFPVQPAPQPVPTPTPVPVPPPTPTPTPGPTPEPVDEADQLLWEEVKDWTEHRHTGSNRRAVKAVLAWAAAKGLS
jgi:hypothetical protein